MRAQHSGRCRRGAEDAGDGDGFPSGWWRLCSARRGPRPSVGPSRVGQHCAEGQRRQRPRHGELPGQALQDHRLRDRAGRIGPRSGHHQRRAGHVYGRPGPRRERQRLDDHGLGNGTNPATSTIIVGVPGAPTILTGAAGNATALTLNRLRIVNPSTDSDLAINALDSDLALNQVAVNVEGPSEGILDDQSVAIKGGSITLSNRSSTYALLEPTNPGDLRHSDHRRWPRDRDPGWRNRQCFG